VTKAVVWRQLCSKGPLGLFAHVKGLVHLPELQYALGGTSAPKGLEADSREAGYAAGAIGSLVRGWNKAMAGIVGNESA
jgi:hypothetical protein